MASLDHSSIQFPLAVGSLGERRNLMARRRYQRGTLIQEGKTPTWKARYLEDVVLANGTRKRVHKKVVLGGLKEYPTRRLAMRAMEQVIAEVNSLSYKPKHLISFSSFADKWEAMVMPNHKPSTQAVERGQVKALKGWFGEMAIGEIETEILQHWITSLRLSPKTVRNFVATLRMMWKSARAWGYVKTNPFEDLILPARGLAKAPSLSPEQAREVIRRAEEPYKTMFWIVAETGMRGGEVCGLRVEDIDIASRTIHIRQSAWNGKVQTPKTANAIRHFIISAQLAAHISTGVRPIAGLMFSVNGHAMDNHNVVQKHLRPILQDMKVYEPRMGLHSFRH